MSFRNLGNNIVGQEWWIWRSEWRISLRGNSFRSHVWKKFVLGVIHVKFKLWLGPASARIYWWKKKAWLFAWLTAGTISAVWRISSSFTFEQFDTPIDLTLPEYIYLFEHTTHDMTKGTWETVYWPFFKTASICFQVSCNFQSSRTSRFPFGRVGIK